MKAVKSNLHRVARIIVNTNRRDKHQWARIVENGKTVHTGQLPYIRRIAKEKYNLNPSL